MGFQQLTDYKAIAKNGLCVAQGGKTCRGPCALEDPEAGFMYKVPPATTWPRRQEKAPSSGV